MTIAIRRAERFDLDSLVELAVAAQRDPEWFCAYLGDERTAVASDVTDVSGPNGDDWTSVTWVAVEDQQMVGWILAEVDSDMGRVWWWGPVVATSLHESAAACADTADRLLADASRALDDISEHEMAIDVRSSLLAAVALRQGFVADDASMLLRTAPFGDVAWTGDTGVVPIEPWHHRSVAALHDELFAGTHTTGDRLVDTDSRHHRLVIEADGDIGDEIDTGDEVDAGDATTRSVVGYIATEVQSDGSLYVDFLGVAEGSRGRGLGRRLVSAAMRSGAQSGSTHAHLTVRSTNTAALRLYESVGFITERVIVPYRRGFSLD